jgi:hypothetical protein
MRLDLVIYIFMVVGTLGGSVNHLFNFEDVAKDLSPYGFQDKKSVGGINPAAQFWGGEFAGCLFLAMGIMAALYGQSSIVREAFLVLEALVFLLLALCWYVKGESVGNTNLQKVISLDVGLGISAIVGAVLTRHDRARRGKSASVLAKVD